MRSRLLPVLLVAAASLVPVPAGAQKPALPAGDSYEREIRLLAEANPPRIHEALDVAERARAPASAGTMLGSAAVQASLREDEIVVTFFLAESQSFRWVMSREHLVFDRIADRSAIEKDATRLRERLRTPAAGPDAKDAALRLGAMLFDGITTADDRPLVIVPHGVLHDVPFEVLTVQNRTLAERHPISYAPSLNALGQRRTVPPNAAPHVTEPAAEPMGLTLLAAALALGAVAIVIQRSRRV